ncbi:probable disease resistance protein RXW24L [Coffea arabica]|uniref:Probable disease resistance protein RXW24L n=1 Tax=Coffea arabica TaxID=13443 RepID=A0ABM4VGU3_COFAR
MVEGQGEETLVEVAEQYLTELVSRSMVQVEVIEFPTTTTIRYDSCWLHGLMRELCLMKCIEEDFLKVVDFQDKSGEVKFWDPNPIIGSNDTYRLAIHTDRYVDGDAIVTQEISVQQLRSFISINFGQGENWSAEIARSPKVFNKFKYLHVLDFQFYSFGDNKILEVIEELIHLRFLRLCNSNMDELPLGIFNLPFLQSLDLRLDYWNVPTKVPNQNVKWKAKRLRNIFFENTDARLVDQGKFRLLGLDQLEKLSNFCSETMEVRDLCKLVTLHYFSATIFGNESLSLVLSCIEENWPRIRHVEIHIKNCHFTSLQNENGASNLLRKVFMSRNLHGLSIEGGLGRGLPNLGSELAIKQHWLELIRSEMVEDPLEMLEKLPNLRKLRLLGAFVGKEMFFHAKGFPNFKHLVLRGLHKLEKLRVNEGAICNL